MLNQNLIFLINNNNNSHHLKIKLNKIKSKFKHLQRGLTYYKNWNVKDYLKSIN